MGDRTFLEMYFRKCDAALVAEHMGEDENQFDEAGNPAVYQLIIEEINYGGYDERCALANAGVPFHGSHGASVGSYSSCHFVGFEGKLYEQLDNDNGWFMIPIDHNGEISERDIQSARRFIWINATVQLLFAETPAPPEDPQRVPCPECGLPVPMPKDYGELPTDSSDMALCEVCILEQEE